MYFTFDSQDSTKLLSSIYIYKGFNAINVYQFFSTCAGTNISNFCLGNMGEIEKRTMQLYDCNLVLFLG